MAAFTAGTGTAGSDIGAAARTFHQILDRLLLGTGVIGRLRLGVAARLVLAASRRLFCRAAEPPPDGCNHRDDEEKFRKTGQAEHLAI